MFHDIFRARGQEDAGGKLGRNKKADSTGLFFNTSVGCKIKFSWLLTEVDIARFRRGVGEALYRDGDPGTMVEFA